ncbi:glycosyltransferase [Kocuria rhizophila]|uniref:glycosyltransferase n=1 Tax=Kocuria rhizophila TaxID=72000 RepID=UPI001ADA4059|nr:glycosyltransferase [Kocuria rhizophila]MDN3226585.1 glycosyltransferase [Kocuria rhizophila]QTK32126.1 glycosyltransferase [Kocuria rhizophila]
MPPACPDRVLLLSMHTSPVDQPGSGDAGGMNVYVWHLARALAQAGWLVDMATLDRDPSHAEGVHPTDLAPGIRLLAVSLPGAATAPKQDLPCFAEPFGRALAHFYDGDDAAPRVMHAHYWLSGVAGTELADALAAPLVLTLHTSAAAKNLRAGADESPEPREREDAERRIISRACRTVVNTPVEGRQLVELYGADPSRIEVIPPGVDPTVFHPAPQNPTSRSIQPVAVPRTGEHTTVRPGSGPDAASPAPAEPPGRPAPFTVLCAGRMQPLKGQQVLVRALGQLRRTHPEPPVRLVLAGTGSPEFLDHLRELAGAEGVAGDVVLCGSLPRPELARLMGSVDAVAVPSSSETFGLVAVEAQACGTPVLATDVDGLRYAVRDGETGRLVPGRDPAVWAEALHRAAADPAAWRAMSQAAAQRARELTWDDVAAQHVRTYLACAGTGATA